MSNPVHVIPTNIGNFGLHIKDGAIQAGCEQFSLNDVRDSLEKILNLPLHIGPFRIEEITIKGVTVSASATVEEWHKLLHSLNNLT